MSLKRAHAQFEIKSIDDGERIIEGFASTPTPDRGGDVLDPRGATFTLPLPLLWQHRHDQPIGEVVAAKVGKDGIWIKAQIAKGVLPYIDDAWSLIRARLVRRFSVGWKPLEPPTVAGKIFTFPKWLWAETSAVTVAMNDEAVIAMIKSLDTATFDAYLRTKGVPSNISLTLAPRDEPWSAPSLSDFTDESWGDLSATERRRIAGHYAWSETLPPDTFGELSLPHHRASDGAVVWRGVAAAAARLDQTDIPADGLAAVKAHLRRHYEQFEQEIPDILKDGSPAATGTKGASSSRRTPPGDTGTSVVRLRPSRLESSMATKTLGEQISALEAKRAANAAAMETVMQKSIDDGRSTDVAEQEEFDTLESETDAIDKDLVRLKALEKVKAGAAKPIRKIENTEDGTQTRTGSFRVGEPPKLAPGIAFARLARVKALAKLDGESPRTIAKEMYGEDSPVFRLLSKAAVPAATTTNPTWAGALVGDDSSVFADFVEWLRPQTIVGRFGTNGVPNLRRVPFRVPLIGQTSGGAGYWVGEGKAKPLTKFDFERKILEPLKVANIAVATMEVLRDSSPSAETIIRDQLAAALRERLDLDFIDPAKAAVAGVSPASITNGVTPIPSSGSTAEDVRRDIQALFAEFIAANNAPTSGVWIMSATTALALSLMQNPLGQSEFPGVGMTGGTFFGLPVIVSQYVPSGTVVLANASDIYLADEGGIDVDMSTQASLQMDDAPTNTSDVPTPISLVSLWQTNSVGFRAERTINWLRRREASVAVLSGVAWGATGSP